MRWPQQHGGAALSASGGFVFAKKVAIKPRLEFQKTFLSPEMQSEFRESLQRTVEEWVRA